MSVLGFKKEDGTIEKYDYEQLDNIPKRIWANDTLFETTIVAETDLSTTISTDVDFETLRKYEEFAIVLRGASNTALSNFYISAYESGAISGTTLMRMSSASAMFIYRWADSEHTVAELIACSGNPSTMVGIVGTNPMLSTANMDISVAQTRYIDFSTLSDTAVIKYKCANAPTINYTLKIIGVIKNSNVNF